MKNINVEIKNGEKRKVELERREREETSEREKGKIELREKW